jgi:hypothetical protein
MGSAWSIQRPHEPSKRQKRNPALEYPARVKDHARVAKAYAVTAMHFDVMRKGFRNAVAASFETSRQALNSHHKQRTNEERALLAEEGRRQRDADGAAALPDGCAKFLCPEERVRLKLAEPSRSKAQVKALTPAQKRQRALERGALSAVLTGRMLAEPGFKSADAALVAFERGFPDLTSKILHVHFKAHPGEAPGHVGAPCIFGPEQEDKIVLWVQAMRCSRTSRWGRESATSGPPPGTSSSSTTSSSRRWSWRRSPTRTLRSTRACRCAGVGRNPTSTSPR